MENETPESDASSTDKPKKKRPPILPGQIQAWQFRRLQSSRAIAEDFFLLVLNAIWKGTNRNQETAGLTLFVQEGWTSITKDRHLAKSFDAFYAAKEKVEALGYELDEPNLKKVKKQGLKLTTLRAKVKGLKGKDAKPIFKLYNKLKRKKKRQIMHVNFNVIGRR